MDLEARTGDPALRPSLLVRLREHKIRLLALKKGLRSKGAAASGPEAAARSQQMNSVLDSDISADDSASSAGASDPHSQVRRGTNAFTCSAPAYLVVQPVFCS